ncbi:hypothetical protein FOPG_18228 [Fusarium oxysporum f. sp. conglutinans race 2 54008]|uniref:Uncharacterized protein n=1 Tax=Fusarium oxysporum f. sp. conglutinans race 2 54008 TaxID=1089457 RepID=X0HWL7_FUSOX|nr:hypothetical protein FOPG_18228 [Fusarium oxysporum f. sp. conglutinans race 2 54008]
MIRRTLVIEIHSEMGKEQKRERGGKRGKKKQRHRRRTRKENKSPRTTQKTQRKSRPKFSTSGAPKSIDLQRNRMDLFPHQPSICHTSLIQPTVQIGRV